MPYTLGQPEFVAVRPTKQLYTMFQEESSGMPGWAIGLLIGGGVLFTGAAGYIGWKLYKRSKKAPATAGLSWIDYDREGNIKLDTNEIGLWVDNDEGLYNWWKGSRQSKAAFIRNNRDELKRHIQAKLSHKPMGGLSWCQYGGKHKDNLNA